MSKDSFNVFAPGVLSPWNEVAIDTTAEDGWFGGHHGGHSHKGQGDDHASDVHVAAARSAGMGSSTGGPDDMIGGRGGDRFEGGGGDDNLIGGGGNDYLDGEGGDDYMAGGPGKDTMKGGDGNDRIAGGKHNDKLTGGADNDTFGFGSEYGRDKITDFQQGHDRISFEEALIDYSKVRITYHDHEAIVRTDGGKILLQHFDGTLHQEDFIF